MRHWVGIGMRGIVAAALLAAGGMTLAGCGFTAKAYEQVVGKAVDAEYRGLDGKRVALVVYADDATLFEYPAARLEVSDFAITEFKKNMPNVQLVDPKRVIEFQNETLNWENLPVKDIGKHFGVDRVLYVELLEYSTREPGSTDLLRGRLTVNASVYEVDTPGDQPVWHDRLAEIWPRTGPLDVLRSNDVVVRQHVLAKFATSIVNRFYDHHELQKPLKEDK